LSAAFGFNDPHQHNADETNGGSGQIVFSWRGWIK